LGDNLVFSVCTHDADTGALADATSVTYRIYEDETATAILNDTMAKLDDDNTLGFYTELIEVTTAKGFESGKTYTVYIEATVDGNTGGIAYAFKVDSLLQRMAPMLIGDVSGAGTGTEIYAYGGVTATVTVTSAGTVTSVVFS
jgi:hypothetical protein